VKPEPLPDVRQTAAHDCATAAWRCVYQFHHGRNARIQDLSNPVAGTDPSTLEAVIRHDASWCVHSGESMLVDLQHYAATWRPAICLMTFPGELDSHYVTVGGVWRGRVYFQDPNSGWSIMKVEEFEACWRGLGRYAEYERWSLIAWPVV